jgi:RimJ/RimL family protein N-acetyltransferase
MIIQNENAASFLLEETATLRGAKLSISKARLNEAREIIDFLNKIGGETDFLTFGLNGFSYSIDEQKKIISKCLDLKQCLMLVGKVDSKIVSQLFLQRFNNVRTDHVAEIGISVDKNNWGQGIASKMMYHAIAWAQNNNITKLQLQVRTDNERAIKLYSKLGFIIEGEIAKAIKINDQYFNDYLMGLLL